MYQLGAAGSTGVRFYMPCHIHAVFVCACVRGDRWHRHTINCHRGQIVLGDFLYRGHFVFGALVLGGFLNVEIMVWWLLSVGFLPGAFDLDSSKCKEFLNSSREHVVAGSVCSPGHSGLLL